MENGDRERAADLAVLIGAVLERENVSAMIEAEAISHALIISIRRSRRDDMARGLLLNSIAGMWDEYAARDAQPVRPS